MPSRPEVERALLRAGATPSHEEAARFYAQRVAEYAKIIGAVCSGLYVVGLVAVLLLMPEEFWAFHLHPSKIFNLVLALLGFGLWRLLRRPEAPGWLALGADIGLPLGALAAIVPVAYTMPARMALYFAPLLLAVVLLVVRAAIVPSPPRRTLAVGLATGVPVVLAGYELAQRAYPPVPFPPEYVAGGIAMWCLVIAVSTSLVSRVIYGLHREVASAKRLGQYVLGELIGEGGMGAVYRAQHAMLRRPTAVKLLLPDRAGPENIARFEREVRLTARLTHPNTVAVYDYGRTPDGTFYYAMEYLDGLSLEELVRRYGPQPVGRVVHLLLQASAALIEAHSLGLIHRDVKPANMLLCERGGVPDVLKLLDFGLVKSLVPAQGVELTHTDAITGTPQYFAPESIVDPSHVDARVDLYALGGVAYFLLCGRPAFEGKSVLEICGHHLHTAPEPPSERLGTPVLPELERLVLACLEKDRERRPRDASELHERLHECSKLAPWSRADANGFWRAFRRDSERADAVRDQDGQLSDLVTEAS
jgi:hypothetical protein